MTPTRSFWTRHDLELYVDNALDAAATEQLSEALRESPDLRRRLAQVTRLDSIATAALLKPTPSGRPTTPRWAAMIGLVGAAAMLLVAVLFLRSTPHASPLQPIEPAPIVANTETPDSMIIFSFPLRTPATEPKRHDKAPTDRAIVVAPADQTTPSANDSAHLPSKAKFSSMLDAALARGDAGAAAALLATTDAELRVEGYRRLGTVLRSVTTARRVLDELPIDAQLAACRELVLEPRWRTITCTHLTTLREDPSLREAVDALLTELSRSPDLAPLVERVRTSRNPSNPAPSDRSI